MNVSNSLRNVEAGTYAIATQTFSAYTKDIIGGKSTTHILYVKTGDMFLIIEKDPETYSRWPIKILTEEHGPLYFSNLDAHQFLYVKCGDNLIGKSFCITGELSAPRVVCQKIIEMNGGKYKSTISKSLNYLVTNETRTSTKMVKAQELGVTIIREYEFLAMVG
jgi:NAD-dependent DNA ligase